MIKLYDFLSCPYGQKVRIVLAEKSLSYDLVPVDLTQGEHRKQDFLRLNPFARVPVLVDEDTTIYDSTIINEYLEDEYPEPPVLPPVGSSAMRSRARIFEDFADTSFTPQVGQLIAEASKGEGADQAQLQRLHQRVERILDYLNNELKGQQYIAGEFSVADIGFAPRLLVLKDLGIDVAGNNRVNVDGWLKRMLERASIKSLEGVSVEVVPGG